MCSTLLSFKIKVKNIHSNYEGVNLIEIRHQYIKVLIIYLILTAIVFILLTFSGIRLFEGLNLSMTIISSGGFIPTNFLDEIIKSQNQTIAIAFCMLIPLFNLYLIYNIFFSKKALVNNKEDLYLLIFLLFILILIYIFFSKMYYFNSILFAVISSLSNIGLGINVNYYK